MKHFERLFEKFFPLLIQT